MSSNLGRVNHLGRGDSRYGYHQCNSCFVADIQLFRMPEGLRSEVLLTQMRVGSVTQSKVLDKQ